MQNEFISIIVPIYNAERTLRDTIESLVKQTFYNYEIVLVNDGSNDYSGVICGEYQKKYPTKIRYISTINGGVSAARAIGVKEARGSWITFVDSDDQLPRDALQVMYNSSKNADIVYANCLYVDEFFKNQNSPPIKVEKKELRGEDYLLYLLKRKLLWTPWGKLYSRKLFDDNTFNISREITSDEDFIMNIRLAQKCSCVLLIPDIVYYYRVISKDYGMTLKSSLLAFNESLKGLTRKQKYVFIKREAKTLLRGIIKGN